jgi:hypothetical protein
MPFATLSVENRIRERMKVLGISASFLAALGRVEVSKLSLAFRGIKQFSNEDGNRLLAITDELVGIAEAVKPLALPSNVPDMQRVLGALNTKSPDDIRSIMVKVFEQQ